MQSLAFSVLETLCVLSVYFSWHIMIAICYMSADVTFQVHPMAWQLTVGHCSLCTQSLPWNKWSYGPCIRTGSGTSLIQFLLSIHICTPSHRNPSQRMIAKKAVNVPILTVLHLGTSMSLRYRWNFVSYLYIHRSKNVMEVPRNETVTFEGKSSPWKQIFSLSCVELTVSCVFPH